MPTLADSAPRRAARHRSGAPRLPRCAFSRYLKLFIPHVYRFINCVLPSSIQFIIGHTKLHQLLAYCNMIGHIMQYYNESIIIGRWSIQNNWNMIIFKLDERDLNIFLAMF
jgi:hypothetical protein